MLMSLEWSKNNGISITYLLVCTYMPGRVEMALKTRESLFLEKEKIARHPGYLFARFEHLFNFFGKS
jgi:hypothetical protein